MSVRYELSPSEQMIERIYNNFRINKVTYQALIYNVKTLIKDNNGLSTGSPHIDLINIYFNFYSVGKKYFFTYV